MLNTISKHTIWQNLDQKCPILVSEPDLVYEQVLNKVIQNWPYCIATPASYSWWLPTSM